MKCIILLSLVALCYSYQYGPSSGSWYGYGATRTGSIFGSGRNIYTNPDGSISLTTANGKTITLSRGIGQDDVTITTVPAGQYGQYVSYRGYQPGQADTLEQIFNQYQGPLNQNVYQQLLQEVSSAVQSGQLSNSVYQALQNLFQGQSQGYYGNQVSYPSSAFQQVYGVQNTGVQAGAFPYGFYQQSQTTYPRNARIQDVLGQEWPNYGIGRNFWATLLSGNGQQYVPYGQYSQFSQYQAGPFGQNVVGQLSQVAEVEQQILNQQNQINQQQIQQQQQQEQLVAQQLQQQQLQQQQQNEQQYVQQLQQQVQQAQAQVLEQQQQQQQGAVLRNLLQRIYQQQQPSVYPQRGYYGVYGQGIQGFNVPVVV